MIQRDLDEFLKIFQKLQQAESEEPVVQPIPATELLDTLDIQLGEEGLDDETFYETLSSLVMNTPRTSSNLFFNQLFGGRNGKAVLGDLLSIALNNSMYTYKVAGPMVGAEKEVIKRVCELIGYGSKADGTLAPGGSMSNFMSLVMARDAYNDDVRNTGVQGQMIVYTSAASHYSIAKNAALAGVGRAQVRLVETDQFGVMSVDDLRKQVAADKAAGYHPIMVNATAGTTVLGAFDPIEPLAAACEEHNIWLHVDGAYCGAVIFSDKHKHLVQGLSKTNSFSFNAHKMLGTPLSCSIIVTQERNHLLKSFSNDAGYLYQTDGDEYNLGKTSLQCGRRNDALKFWALWKSIGAKGLAEMVDHQFFLADVALEYVKNHPDYTVYSYEESVSICFNYKGIPAEKLCTALYNNASIMVGYGTFRDDTFVRMVTVNANNTKADILNFFQVMETFVAEHEEELLKVEEVAS